MKDNSNLFKIFNVRNEAQTTNFVISDEIKKYLSDQDLKKLIDRQTTMRNKKSFNISNKKTEEQKVIRLKNESASVISELHQELTKAGLDIPLAILADFLILKAVNKI
jgi:hypothetical protein